MHMKFRSQLAIISGMLLLVAGTAWAGSPPASPQSTQPDVTMMVIPGGQDVLKTVVQTINVPPPAHPGKRGGPATGNPANGNNQSGQQPAQAADTAAQAAEYAAQQARQAAAHESAQAQQAQQQAQRLSHEQPHPPHPLPPPPPHGHPGSGTGG